MEDGQQSVLAEISREMVRVYKEQFGRGPTRARTQWAGPRHARHAARGYADPVERRLVSMGEHGRVRDMRTFFQYASRPQFCEPVERLTGRKVRAFLSAIDPDVDGVAIETFVFEPET